jgi:hypothetical protein
MLASPLSTLKLASDSAEPDDVVTEPEKVTVTLVCVPSSLAAQSAEKVTEDAGRLRSVTDFFTW